MAPTSALRASGRGSWPQTLGCSRTCLCVCVYVCMCVRACVCVCVCVCVVLVPHTEVVAILCCPSYVFFVFQPRVLFSVQDAFSLPGRHHRAAQDAFSLPFIILAVCSLYSHIVFPCDSPRTPSPSPGATPSCCCPAPRRGSAQSSSRPRPWGACAAGSTCETT